MIYVANAGDSKCIMGVNRECVEMSQDHIPSLSSERIRIYKAGGRITKSGRIEGSLNLSRSIGDLRFKQNKDFKAQD